MSLAPIFVELKATSSDFTAKMAAARKEVAKLGTESAGNMQKLSAVGKAAFLGLGASALVGAGVAIKAAGDYQQSLTELVTGAGESERNIKLVGDGMLHMAGKVGISALDLSHGMYLIESAGYHGAQGLTVLKAAAEGARVGAADMATVADGLTTALNDYHLPASQAAQVTSQLVATVAAGKTHMQDLAGALSKVLPAASAAHVGLSQVLGAMATMTAGGTPAADAATYLRQTILQLANPTAKAALEMKNLGLSAIDISSHLGQRGLTGTLDLLTGAIEKHMGPAGTVLIEQLKKASAHTTTFQQVLANLPPTQQTYVAALANMVGGTKSMQAALELTGGNAATFAANVKAIGATTTEAGGHVKGFGLTQKDLNTQLENARAAFQSVVIEVGQKLIPVMADAMGFLQKHRTLVMALAVVVGTVLVAAIGVYVTNLTIATARSVAAFASDVAAGALWVAQRAVQFALVSAGSIASAATATAAWVASTAATLASGAVAAAGWVAKTVVMAAASVASAAVSAAAWVVANAAMIAGIALVVVAVVAAVALIIKYHKDIEKAVVAVWHAIEAAAKAVWQAIQTVVHTVIAIITGYITVEEKAWEAVFHAVEAVVKTVWNNVEGATKTVISDITGFFAKLPGQILGFLTGLPGDFLKLGESVVSAFLNAFKDIGGKVGGMLKGALGHIPGVGGLMSHIPGLAEGGLVTRPTLALVGESGPEMVVPLSKFATAGTHGVQALPSGGGVSSQTGMAGGTVINVIMNVGGSVLTEGELVRTIQQGLLKLQQRTGNLGFTAA